MYVYRERRLKVFRILKSARSLDIVINHQVDPDSPLYIMSVREASGEPASQPASDSETER